MREHLPALFSIGVALSCLLAVFLTNRLVSRSKRLMPSPRSLIVLGLVAMLAMLFWGTVIVVIGGFSWPLMAWVVLLSLVGGLAGIIAGFWSMWISKMLLSHSMKLLHEDSSLKEKLLSNKVLKPFIERLLEDDD